MSLEPPEPLPPDLAALLDDERARPMPPELDPDALLRALTADLRLDAPDAPPADAPVAPGPAGAGPPAATTAGFGALKAAGLAATFALGVAAGAGGHAALRRPERVVVERVVRVPVERRVEVPAAPAVEATAAPPPAAPAVAAPPSPPRPHAAPEDAPSNALEREIALIDQATAALARDNHAAALASTREHLRRFPDGAMSEDRERLWIDALARSGRRDEARARAAEFFRRFPDSVHRARVERVVAGAP